MHFGPGFVAKLNAPLAPFYPSAAVPCSRQDRWEPKEEGLDPIETTRHVSVITITLSKARRLLP